MDAAAHDSADSRPRFGALGRGSGGGPSHGACPRHRSGPVRGVQPNPSTRRNVRRCDAGSAALPELVAGGSGERVVPDSHRVPFPQRGRPRSRARHPDRRPGCRSIPTADPLTGQEAKPTARQGAKHTEMAMVERRHSPRAVPVGQDNNRSIRDANSLIGEAFDDGSGLLDVICVHAGKFPRPAGELTRER